MDKPWLAHYPKEVAPSYDYPDKHLAMFLLDTVARFPKRPALVFYGKSITYRQLLEECYTFVHVVQSLGLEKGDRIAIMLPNCPQAVVAYYGALIAGLVVVETNPMYTPREIAHQMHDSGAKAIIALDLLLDSVKKGIQGTAITRVVVTSIRDALPRVKSLLYPLKQGHPPKVTYNTTFLSWHRLMTRAARNPVGFDPAAGDTLALLQYTGGTTGLSKGVMLTHRNLVTNTIQCRHWCYRLREGQEVILGVLPFFHVFGMTASLNLSVYLGATLVLLPRFDLKQIMAHVRRYRPTAFSGTPTMFIAMLNRVDSEEDLASFNVCISGSAPLPKEVQEQFERVSGGRLVEGYGLTEASPITHANNLWEERRTGIGLPYPDTEAIVVDTLGQPVPVGDIGELWVRGPQVMQGYWNRREETASVLRDGWLHTGDLARMDSDGFFEIAGRSKDVIIAGGFNIYPREVEEVLYEHPAVEEAVVVGVPDPYRGETVKACLLLKAGMTTTQEELDQFCRKSLAAYKVPHVYEIRDALPKSAVGKVLRYKLVEEAVAGRNSNTLADDDKHREG